MRMVRRAFVVLALAASAPFVAAPVFAESTALNALASRDALLGWEAVGRIEIGDSGFCTGTLIATDLVLTAAHCLYNPAEVGTLNDVSTYRFRAGLRTGEVIAERKVLRAFVHPGYVHTEKGTAEGIRHDIAILQLDEPIPAAQANPFPIATLPDAQREIAVVSYAAGRENALSIQRRCDVTARGGGLYQFDCDVAPGSSGAPVFDMSEGRGRIVSVVSSGYDDGSHVVSYGMEIESLVSDVTQMIRSAGPVAQAAAPAILKAGQTRAGGARFLKAP